MSLKTVLKQFDLYSSSFKLIKNNLQQRPHDVHFFFIYVLYVNLSGKPYDILILMTEIDDIPLSSFKLPQEYSAPSPDSQPQNEYKSEPHSDLVARYRLFDREVKPIKRVVYHPCGATDVSPSVAFPGSRVIYVELNEHSVDALKRDGYEAYHASATEYDPGDIDILIMINPDISSFVPSSHVIENGHVLCNNYHGTASQLRDNPDFKFKGLIRFSEHKGLIYDTDNLEDCWREIETDEEYINAPLDWGAANYETAASVVEVLTGKRENVLFEYKKIITLAREQQRKINNEMLLKFPEAALLLGNPDEEDVLMFNYEGRQFTIPTNLPRKKGTVDDLFVFERISKIIPSHTQSLTAE